jgi:hypothetical protein
MAARVGRERVDGLFDERGDIGGELGGVGCDGVACAVFDEAREQIDGKRQIPDAFENGLAFGFVAGDVFCADDLAEQVEALGFGKEVQMQGWMELQKMQAGLGVVTRTEAAPPGMSAPGSSCSTLSRMSRQRLRAQASFNSATT